MSHAPAIAVFALIPCAAGLALGRRAPAVAVIAFALAALGEGAGWWRASWIFGEGPLGRSVGLVVAVLYALPALALGMAVAARRRARPARGT